MTEISAPSWWEYVGDADRQFLDELDTLIRERKPIPETHRLSILLALQHLRAYGQPKEGRPRKDVQYFWLAFHYLLGTVTQDSKKAAALHTSEVARVAGIHADYKAIQRKANEPELLQAVCDFRDVILATGLLPKDYNAAYAVLLQSVEEQVQKLR